MVNPKSFTAPNLITLTDQELACVYLLRYVLQTHSELATADLDFASNYLTSFYSASLLGQTDDPFSRPQLVQLATYANQTGICRLALTFNQALNLAIINRDQESLQALALGPPQLFVELYDNPWLSQAEAQHVSILVERELLSTELLLAQLETKLLEFDYIPDPVCREQAIYTNYQSEASTLVELTRSCYQEVCWQETDLPDQVEKVLSLYEQPAPYIFTVDKSNLASTPQVYCFDLIELLAAITAEPPINPKTGEQFSAYTQEVIQQRFRTEIALYQRYRETMTPKVEADLFIELELGERKAVDYQGTTFSLEFLDWQDSRCPANVVCVWAGSTISTINFCQEQECHQLIFDSVEAEQYALMDNLIIALVKVDDQQPKITLRLFLAN